MLPQLRLVERKSGRTPQPLQEKPELLPVNRPFWAAFQDLYVRGIPAYSDVRAYAEIVGLKPVELMVKLHACEDGYNDGSDNSGTGSAD